MRMIAGGESFTDHKLCDAQAIKKSSERHVFAKGNQVKLVVDKRKHAARSEQIKAVISDDAAVLPQYTIRTSDQRLATRGKKPDLVQRACGARHRKASGGLRPHDMGRLAGAIAQIHKPLPIPKY